MRLLCLFSLLSTISCQIASGTSITVGQSLNIAKLHFPQPWYESIQQQRPVSHVEKIEVRTLSSAPGEYFFKAIPNSFGPVYSENSFAVKFSAKPQVRNATKQEWDSAARVVTEPRIVVCIRCTPSEGELDYRGRKYSKAGKYWHLAWASPSGKWLAVFSYTGERTKDFAFMDGGSIKSGDVFWEVYNASTGEKVFAREARNVKSPINRGSPIVWLEEHLFIFPTDLDAREFDVLALP